MDNNNINQNGLENFEDWVGHNIIELSKNNGHITFYNFPNNLFIEENKEKNLSCFGKVENLMKLLINKINALVIVDIYFEKQETIPQYLSYYQKILTYFYSLSSQIIKYHQLILVRFPQIVFIPENAIPFDLCVEYDVQSSEISFDSKKYKLSQPSNIDSFSKIYFTNNKDDLFLSNSVPLFKYEDIGYAGSFDHYHIGHNMLLQLGLLLSKKKIHIGVTSDKMISHKCEDYLLQYSQYRVDFIKKIVQLSGYHKEATIIVDQIYDPIDFAGISKEMQSLIITSETLKGGAMVNEARLKNGLNEIDLTVLNVINYSNQNKISSTLIRNEIKNKINEEKMKFLFENWKNLMKCLNQNEETSIYLWSTVRDEYMKKWKYYHNLNHIYQLIQLYDIYKVNDIDFLIALWFHDIIYVPSRNDNEKQSIEFFKQILKDFFNQPISTINIDRVAMFIQETANHFKVNKVYDDKLVDLFLDFDISIFSMDDEIDEYEKNIKNEYLFYGEEKYNEERIRILQILLEKEYIYRTELFKKAFEEKARNNIKKIIESLQKKFVYHKTIDILQKQILF